jgi:branched-chain amino acid transport system ATP-binding protein
VTAALLEADGLRAGFGSNAVLHGVTLSVREGQIAAVLGLNGAGKSVTMKVLGGVVPAWGGRITLDGADIGGLTAEQRVGRGIGHVPQGRQVFPDLTVEQNLRLGAYMLRRRDRRRYAPALERTFDRFPRLGERRRQLAGTLSGGEQAVLALARALMSEPKLLFIDEPTAGLAPIVIDSFLETLKEVNASGVSMLLVEQNVPFALRLAHRVHIMQRGRIVYESDIASLDQEAMIGYLGIGRLLSAGVVAAGGAAAAGARRRAKTNGAGAPRARKARPRARETKQP